MLLDVLEHWDNSANSCISLKVSDSEAEIWFNSSRICKPEEVQPCIQLPSSENIHCHKCEVLHSDYGLIL